MSYVTKSPWVVHYDGSSCNGCDIEVLACLTPMYDAERFGIINTGNPKHADIFLVTGGVNEQNKNVVKQIYDQMLQHSRWRRSGDPRRRLRTRLCCKTRIHH